MAIPEKKPYERLSDYLERSLPAELEAGKSRGKATADIIFKFNEEPPREMFAPFIWGATNASGSAGGGAYDTDAQAFFTAVEGGGDTLTTTEKDAVNQLVLDLKVGNEWNQSQWIYPFVGGTASSMKWNLKNPVNTDAGYRLTFGTAMSFNSNGIIGIGSNPQTYANTHYNQSTNSDTNGLVSLYLNQNMGAGGATPTNWYDFGAASGGENAFIMGYNNKTTMYSQWGTGGFLTAGSGWTYVNDLFTSMNDGTTLTMYQGTTSVASTTKGFSAVNLDLTIAGSNRGAIVQENSGRGYGFAYYSNNVSGLSISNLDSAVSTFTTALSRNV